MFNFVEHASFEVAYVRLEVDFDGVPIASDDCSCSITDYSFDGLSFFVGKMLVLGSQSCNFFHVDCVKLFPGREVTAVRSSDVYVGKKLVPVAHRYRFKNWHSKPE